MPSTHRGQEVGDNHFNKRQTSRFVFTPDGLSADSHRLQARALAADSPWTQGFAGTYLGPSDQVNDAGARLGRFSAEATQGDSTDVLYAAWEGSKDAIGKRFALLPTGDHNDVGQGAHAWELGTASDGDDDYQHLPGFKGPRK